MVTGDDAIEFAFERRPTRLGNAIGINIRVASYAGVGKERADTIRDIVQESARDLGAPLAGIPISRHPSESDVESVGRILDGFPNVLEPVESVETPESVIIQAGKCRIVITGSYHGAVFSLSQGVPVVGLANSTYYTAKFEGLAEQFGAGCRHVELDHPRFAQILRDAIHQTWTRAPQHRPLLLEAADRQVELGRRAYRRVHDEIGR